MTNRLEAWLEGRHAGAFECAPNQPVTFTYDDDAPATPVSLSLPRQGTATERAAGDFLENLLPITPRPGSVWPAPTARGR